jgi:hypothetical protein
MPNNRNVKAIKDTIRDFIYTDLFPPRTGNDIVSSNSKVVLYGLFALIGFAILTYAITVTGCNYNTNNNTCGNTLTDTQKLNRLSQLEHVNAVYIAAISGALALGGTLIAQLWGRS